MVTLVLRAKEIGRRLECERGKQNTRAFNWYITMKTVTSKTQTYGDFYNRISQMMWIS